MEIITTHLNADFDGLASMIAAHKLYPDAELAFAGSQEKNLRTFLANSTRVYQFQRQKNIDMAKVTRLILVDTRQPSRLGNFAKCLNNPGISIHIYDHHPDLPGDLRGDYEDIRPIGSTATIFTKIFRERKIEVDKDEATILAMAIYEGPQAPDRFVIKVLFEDVEKLSLTCNFPELADHFSAGNIDWATRDGDSNYRFDLFGDNSFELISSKVTIQREH